MKYPWSAGGRNGWRKLALYYYPPLSSHVEKILCGQFCGACLACGKESIDYIAAVWAEKTHHAGHIGKKSPSAAKTNSIKAMQNTQDILAEALYKVLHDVASPVLGLD